MLSTMSTAHPSPQNLHSLFPQWHVKRRNASFIKRLGMRCIELLFVAAAMFILPSLINGVVQSLDSFYELMGRRAQSPFVDIVPWGRIFVAIGSLLGWHIWLGWLSYQVALERDKKATRNHEEKTEERVSWGRVLEWVRMPLLIFVCGCYLGYEFVGRLMSPLPLIVWESAGQDAKFEAGRREL